MKDKMGNVKKKEMHWFKEWLVYGKSSHLSLLPLALFAIMIAVIIPNVVRSKLADDKKQIIIYTAQDQVYAESILRGFEKDTGIQALAVYDSESVKTVGLANRLLAESNHPQCDVFWGNEEVRTRQLAAGEVFEAWAAFGHRSRQLVVNTNFVLTTASKVELPLVQDAHKRVPTLLNAPQSLLELTNAQWRGRVALAYPLFGTTATHFLALRQHWGESGWLSWCRALVANDALVVDGNSMVVKLVGRGEAWIGLTDSDDIAAFQREGLPIAPVALKETLFIPNTVAIVRGAPHPEQAQRLFDYLQSPVVVERLVKENALQGAGAMMEGGLKPDWTELLGRLEQDTAILKGVFLR